jgi:hypothetical protein
MSHKQKNTGKPYFCKVNKRGEIALHGVSLNSAASGRCRVAREESDSPGGGLSPSTRAGHGVPCPYKRRQKGRTRRRQSGDWPSRYAERSLGSFAEADLGCRLISRARPPILRADDLGALLIGSSVVKEHSSLVERADEIFSSFTGWQIAERASTGRSFRVATACTF